MARHRCFLARYTTAVMASVHFLLTIAVATGDRKGHAKQWRRSPSTATPLLTRPPQDSRELVCRWRSPADMNALMAALAAACRALSPSTSLFAANTSTVGHGNGSGSAKARAARKECSRAPTAPRLQASDVRHVVYRARAVGPSETVLERQALTTANPKTSDDSATEQWSKHYGSAMNAATLAPLRNGKATISHHAPHLSPGE